MQATPQSPYKCMLFLHFLMLFVGVLASRSFSPCDPMVVPNCTAKNQAITKKYTESLQQASELLISSDACPSICQETEDTKLSVLQRLQNPRLYSETYLMYGKVEMEVKGAAGRGLITSFYLLSDDRDEIDIVELFGTEHSKYETNYFTKGQSATDGDGIYILVDSSPINNYHKYGVIWTAEKIEWLLDGRVVRQLLSSEQKEYPKSPMRVLVSLWAGGDPANENGTIEWSGGLTDYTQLPFSMSVKNLVVENYSKGEYYEYTNNSAVVTHSTPLVPTPATNSTTLPEKLPVPANNSEPGNSKPETSKAKNPGLVQNPMSAKGDMD